MLEFIKMFGLGILYTILLPFILMVFAGYLVYVFFNYLVVESMALFGFFFGYTFSDETELEKELILMKEEDVEKKTEVAYQYDETGKYDQEINESIEEGSDEQ